MYKLKAMINYTRRLSRYIIYHSTEYYFYENTKYSIENLVDTKYIYIIITRKQINKLTTKITCSDQIFQCQRGQHIFFLDFRFIIINFQICC